jgi:hypothetical protein
MSGMRKKSPASGTHDLNLPWSYPWSDPDSVAWRLMLDPIATTDVAGTVSGSGQNGHGDPAQTGEGEPPMSTSDDQARAYAVEMAEMLEQQLAPGAVEDFDVLENVLEFIADTRNVLRVVLTTGGPHAELVLGDGAPRIEVWWGGAHHSCWANIDENFVDDFVATWWRPTMEAALKG